MTANHAVWFLILAAAIGVVITYRADTRRERERERAKHAKRRTRRSSAPSRMPQPETLTPARRPFMVQEDTGTLTTLPVQFGPFVGYVGRAA